jgi:L-iditol 2-dehydrogenase
VLQAILASPGSIDLIDVPVPTPRAGELLVHVRAALTCGTDLKAYRRGHPMIPMPGPFGHEFSGEVAAIGRGVKDFRDGDAVMAVHSAPCLKCRFCRKGAYNLCENIMESKILGAFAEYVLLPRHIVKQNVYHKPSRLSFEAAALLEPLACVVHGLEPLNIRRGDTALVMGAGPIGLLHVALLKSHGAEIAIVDPHPARLRTATALGAKLALPRGNARRAMKALTGGMGLDHVIECTGRPEVWQEGVDYLRRGGTLTLFGGCPSGTTVTYDTHRMHYDELHLRGVFHFTPADVKKAYEVLSGRKLKTKEFISGTYPLTGLETALKRLANGRGVKYAIIP